MAANIRRSPRALRSQTAGDHRRMVRTHQCVEESGYTVYGVGSRV